MQDLYKLEVERLVHNYICDNTPTSTTFTNLFLKTHQVSLWSTRSSCNPNLLYIPRYLSNRFQRSIKYQGVKSVEFNSAKIGNYVKTYPQSEPKKLLSSIVLIDSCNYKLSHRYWEDIENTNPVGLHRLWVCSFALFM